MKRLLLLSAVLILAGCDGRAIRFARNTADLLSEYQTRIDRQITDSTDFYQQAANRLAAEEARMAVQALHTERLERSLTLEVDYRESRKPVSHYRAHLRDYAQHHFDQQRLWITAELDGSTPYLAQIMALESDKATVEAFQKVLSSLAQPRSLTDQAADIAQFLADTRSEFNQRACDDSQKRLGALSQAPAAESESAQSEREALRAAITQLRGDLQCKN